MGIKMYLIGWFARLFKTGISSLHSMKFSTGLV